MSTHRQSIRRALAVLSLFAFAATACSDDTSEVAATSPISTEAPAATTPPTAAAAEMRDLVATATTCEVCTDLAGMAVDAGLIETLRGGPFTVFAPTNEAFAKLPVAVRRTVQDNNETLKTVLLHHVVPGTITPDQFAAGELVTAAGDKLTITQDGDTFFADGNRIGTPVEASNGYVYLMDDVLVPALGDIVDVATTLPGFETLASLVTQADLIDTLKGDGPFTVFAPIDDAFDALPAATRAAVLADPALLKTVLTYHVVVGKLTTDQLKPGALTTVAGVDLTVTNVDGVVYIDGNPIAVRNVQASNGVIHVMGSVLVPKS